MIINKKYLAIRTSEAKPESHINVKDENGKALFQLDIRQDKNGECFYLDVSRFIGKNLTFTSKLKSLEFEQVDEANISDEVLRPEIHFTTPYGWLNDPNGLIYIGGEYHLFCQHNPLGTAWGNMHWHHSVSTDLINWKHLGDALFPDEMGTMFSGSAICDKNNVAGFGENAILLYYTIAEYSKPLKKPKFSQGLAYSNDGINFKKYDKNPVVPNIINENRDPKVIYVDEMGCYVMALYLDGDEYCLLKSDDLLNWKMLQSIHIKDEWECPDIYYLYDDEGNKKWIISGASDRYIVGSFDKNGFKQEQGVLRHYQEFDERYSYAAQSFSNINDRVLRVTWENINPNNNRFCGQMSVPMEMGLVKTSDGKLRLKAKVCRELEHSVEIIKLDGACEYKTDSRAFILDTQVDGDFTLDIDGATFEISRENNTITHNGKSITLSVNGGRDIRFIVDKMSIEILADDGIIFASTKHLFSGEERIIKIK